MSRRVPMGERDSVSPVWLVCGSSPLARSSMLRALTDYKPQITITCNGGHRLFDSRTGLTHPVFYFLSDSKACEMYATDAWYMQERFGTMVLTPRRLDSAIRQRGLTKADQFLRTDASAETCAHTPGVYAAQPMSGLYMLDIALNRGARTVLIVGYDGYRSRPGEIVVDYFDGRSGIERSESHNARMAKYLASAVAARPEVRFVMYGSPQYEVPVGAANFELCGAEEVC